MQTVKKASSERTGNLNPLQEFLARRLPSSTSKHLLQAELDYLGKFLSRLSEMASKGVHASVMLAEAKQGPRWIVLLPLQRMSASFAEAVNNGVLYIAGLRKHPRGKIADDS